MPAAPIVTFVHPLDPWRPGVGGFDTTFAGMVSAVAGRWPVEVVGVTSDPRRHPAGRWHDASWRGHPLRFFAALHEPEPDRIRRLPLSLRFVAACRARRVRARGAIVQVLRFETALALPTTPHQHLVGCLLNDLTAELRPPRDLRWRYAPGLYRWLLGRQLGRMHTVLVAAPGMLVELPRRFPALDGRLLELNEWIDVDEFSPGTAGERRRDRRELRRRLDLDPSTRIVVSAGRFAVHKGHELLVRAFARSAALDSDTALLLVGKGPRREHLAAAIRRAGIGDRCRLHPPVERKELARIYRGSDLAVCASERDAGPRLVFEALGCGLPVVSTEVGQAAKLLGDDGSFGILLDRGDEEALATAIHSALGRPHLAIEIERASRRALEFSSERALAPIIRRYEQILEEQTPP